MENRTSGKRKLPVFVRLISLIAATGGLMFGYDIGISGGLYVMDDFLRQFFPSVAEEKNDHSSVGLYCLYGNQRLQLFTSSLYLAAMIATFFAAIVSRRHGRKVTMLMAGIFFDVGVVLMSIAGYVHHGSQDSLTILICGRILMGFGVGFGNQVVPLFLSEIAPAEARGSLNNMFQLNVTIGILVASIVNLEAERIHPWGWRLSLGFAGVPALLLTVGSLLIVETPNSLAQRGLYGKAEIVLRKLRGVDFDARGALHELVGVSHGPLENLNFNLNPNLSPNFIPIINANLNPKLSSDSNLGHKIYPNLTPSSSIISNISSNDNINPNFSLSFDSNTSPSINSNLDHNINPNVSPSFNSDTSPSMNSNINPNLIPSFDSSTKPSINSNINPNVSPINTNTNLIGLASIHHSHDHHITTRRKHGLFGNLLVRSNRPPLLISIAVQLFQQFTGINAVLLYSPVLFKALGVKTHASLYSALIIGSVNMLSTIVSIVLVDRVGRRALLLEASLQMFIAQVLVGFVLIGTGEAQKLPQWRAIVVVFLVCVFVSAFAWSWGALGWLISTEIFPLVSRSEGQSVTVFFNMLFTFLIAQTTLTMLCHMKFVIFFFFAGWSVVMGALTYFFLPETMNMEIEVMDSIWSYHWFWKRFVTPTSTHPHEQHDSMAIHHT